MSKLDSIRRAAEWANERPFGMGSQACHRANVLHEKLDPRTVLAMCAVIEAAQKIAEQGHGFHDKPRKGCEGCELRAALRSLEGEG
jgi:hypothetical protein